MARLRLFANLRETAGTSAIDVGGTSVGEVLGTAVERYGPEFESGLATARVWVNGEPAETDTPVATGDEIAVLPPVSGGETVAPATDYTQVLIEGALTAALIIAAFTSLQIFVFAVVATGLAWVWDLRDVTAARGHRLAAVPPMLAVAAAANGAYGWGYPGFAVGLMIGVAAALAWGVFFTESRDTRTIAVTGLVSALAGLGAGALTLTRMRTVEEAAGFLIVAGLAGLAGWAALTFAPEGLDQNIAAAAVAVVASVIVAGFTDQVDFSVALLGGAAIGAAIIAGRAFGSLLRAGEISHTERAPGLLVGLDGAVLAAAAFWLVLAIFAG
ncbi:MAG: MoaD/ThiS family protein [Acidimicrobiia bacterium]|nr:MoaD/ThiS family protein [Acidimicrobiia bacterium]